MKKTGSKTEQIAWFIIYSFVVLGLIFGVYSFFYGTLYRTFLGLISPIFLLIPRIMERLGLAHPWRAYILLFGFSILAYDVGCVLQVFDSLPHYDKVSHFLSGILFTLLGICLYFYFAVPEHPGDRWFLAATYALFFSCFVAVVWECCEFFGFLLTGHDSQHHLDTGVFDTMGDLIACLIGSFLSFASFALWVKKGTRLLTGWVAEEFHLICKSRQIKRLLSDK